MSRYLRVCAAFLAAVVVLASCGRMADNRRYLRGIGTDLHTSDLEEQTKMLEVYFGYICEQAGIYSPRTADGAPRCNYEAFNTNTAYWNAFVVQGMNDIDRRCDAYLEWLSDKRRSKKAKLQQISDVRTATVAIMRFTGSSATPISVVAQSFGLLSSSVNNYHSRLILEVEGSTVGAVVRKERNKLREELSSKNFANKPQAYHAIRSYLNICLPDYIETEINNIAVVEKRTEGADINSLSPEFFQATALARTSTETLRQQPLPDEPDRPKGAITDVEKSLFLEDATTIQSNLCLKTDGKFGKETRAAIKTYQTFKLGLKGNGVSGTIDTLSQLQDLTDPNQPCGPTSSPKFESAYEKYKYPTKVKIVSLQKRLKRLLSFEGDAVKEKFNDQNFPETGIFDAKTRDAITGAELAVGIGEPSNKLTLTLDKKIDRKITERIIQGNRSPN